MINVDADVLWRKAAVDGDSDQSIFINANGYRGPTFSVRKPSGRFRIIVVGGSAVFDANAKDQIDSIRNTWPNKAETILHERGTQNIEVINAGIPGHSSANSLARFYTQLWMYEPDFVLIYHGWNDFKFWRQLEISPEKPLMVRHALFDPTANPFTNYQNWADKLLSNSRAYSAIRLRYYTRKENTGFEGRIPEPEMLSSDFSEFGPDQFRLNMELIVSASEAIGAMPVLITQATLAANSNTESDKIRIGYRYQQLNHAGIIKAYNRSYQILREIAARHDLPLIDAAAKMNGESEWFDDHVHLTTSGSSVLAKIIADEMANLVPARLPSEKTMQ